MRPQCSSTQFPSHDFPTKLVSISKYRRPLLTDITYCLCAPQSDACLLNIWCGFNNQSRELLRAESIRQQTSQWGFRIYRTTYSDQASWEKFIVLLKDDALEFLEESEDQDHFKGLAWGVIEGQAELNGKNWKEARDVHDAWILDKLEKEAAKGKDNITGHYTGICSARSIIELRTKSKPHWEFFIFADEESVNSVVDADANNTRGQPGTYFITVVQSGLVCKGEMGFSDDKDEDDEDDEDDSGSEEQEPIPRKAYWQRFRGWLLADIYASVVNGSWPKNYHVTEDGLSGIWSYD